MAAKRTSRAVVRYVRRARPRRKGGFTVSAAMMAGMAPLAITSVEAFQEMGVRGVPHNLVMKLTGWDYWTGKWSSTQLMQGVGPLLLGWGVHKLAGKLGINRAIAQAGVPFVRI